MKRYFSWLLALCIALTLFPVSIAAETAEIAEAAEAVEIVEAAETAEAVESAEAAEAVEIAEEAKNVKTAEASVLDAALMGTNGHSQSDAVAWAKAQIGKPLDYDGAYGISA